MVRRTRPQMCNCTSGNLEIPGSMPASPRNDVPRNPDHLVSMTALSLPRPRTRPLISWRVRKLLIDYSYLVPPALSLLATVVVPIILAIKMSLYAEALDNPHDSDFIG